MDETFSKETPGHHKPDIELEEWIESLLAVWEHEGPQRVKHILHRLNRYAERSDVRLPFSANTPYINTISKTDEKPYPGDRAIERRIKSLIRWNAMAMVARADRAESGIGGRISTYASAATLYEVAFNHFFRAVTKEQEGDQIFFQGHVAPVIYARAFLEGRLSVEQLEDFRRQLKPSGGLSSYPHPRLMPDFLEFPTVSMGLSPVMGIYQARFNRYLEDRGLKEKSDARVWVFMGDGETDEPESLGAITLASREKLENLIFVVNCNLQCLAGPVRGNGKIIQELEAVFRGAGWNVIKVIWGSEWDPLLEKDSTHKLVKRMGQVVDGEYQKYSIASGNYIREHFFGTEPDLLGLVEDLSDKELEKLKRGGHDPLKIYNAYRAAVEHKGSPTVILTKAIKGYGSGESGEGKNITHQQKKLNEDELRGKVAEAPFYRPEKDSPELTYLRAQRNRLGGFVPSRKTMTIPFEMPGSDLFAEFFEGSGPREIATTMVFVRLLAKLMQDQEIGRLVVPIVPDEARTFGMEAKDGRILGEGITEAGSMSSFIAAGTAYATHGINMIPFFIFYSMFGFQRIGDLIWAAADQRCRGFLLGGGLRPDDPGGRRSAASGRAQSSSGLSCAELIGL